MKDRFARWKLKRRIARAERDLKSWSVWGIHVPESQQYAPDHRGVLRTLPELRDQLRKLESK